MDRMCEQMKPFPFIAAGCRYIIMLALIGCLLPGTAAAEPQKTAVIVIDDFGNNGRGSQQIMELPFKVTVAVMPFLKYTKSDAERAHAAVTKSSCICRWRRWRAKNRGLDRERLRWI